MVYNAQTTLCKDVFSLENKILGKLVKQALVLFSFSFFFLTRQSPSEDDLLEDEWLKPFPP